MSQDLTPSTNWKENIQPGDDARYASYGDIFADIQKRKSARYGNGRTLHRKQLMAARGTLEVFGGLPAFASHGLFATPGTHEVWARISNGGTDRAPDRMPDIRGLGLRVFGVSGDSALGNGPAKSQDFTLINQEAIALGESDSFVKLVQAASHGNGSLFKYLLKSYGVFGTVGFLSRFAKTLGKPFTGFATEPLYSAVPMACGPYAVRVAVIPAPGNGTPDPQARNDWGADFQRRLAQGPLEWEMRLQPFVNEQITPIENASVNWASPYTPVAKLTLPQQDTQSEAGQAFQKQAEAGVFDPWQALAAHRPLGDIQRARKVVYYRSQQGRGAG